MSIVFAFVKPTLFFLVFALAEAEARAQLKAEPMSLDLGMHQQEQVVNAEVTLTNAGAAALEIVGVTADCSCTAATPEKHTLAPSESTPLRITVQTHTYQGVLHRNVHVLTSAGDLTIPIEIKVSRYKSWELNPADILIPPSPKGREAKLGIALHYTGGDKASLGKLTCTPSWLQATATSEDEKTFSIALVKPADAPAGNHSAKVSVETSDPAEPLLTFNVFVPVISDLRITPNPVVLPTVKVGQLTTREIVINGWSGVREPRLELTLGQVKKLEREGDRLHFEISITPGMPGPTTQLLRIYDGEKLEVEIPVLFRAEPSDSGK